jgi:hypothetical protein
MEARVIHQETSREAYAAIQPVVHSLRERVFEVIETWNDDGIICEDVQLILERPIQSVSARIRELVQSGRVVNSGNIGQTSSGRNAIKWKASA